MKKKILAIFAHPDDEILACGGTLIKRVSEGFNINILILSNGCESRSQSSQNEINHRLKSCEKASEIIGANLLKVGEFPDNKFDSIPLLDIVKYIERNVKDIKPDEIFTHFRSDLNIDHRITFQAVKTVFRPFFMKENSKIAPFSSVGPAPPQRIRSLTCFSSRTESTTVVKLPMLGIKTKPSVHM